TPKDYDPAEDGALKLPFKRDKKTKEEFFKASSKRKPLLQDAKANDLPPSEAPGAGSKARLHVVLEYYKMGPTHGITAYLQGVQVVEMVSRGFKTSFGELEGGYVYEGSEDETREPTTSAEDLADF